MPQQALLLVCGEYLQNLRCWKCPLCRLALPTALRDAIYRRPLARKTPLCRSLKWFARRAAIKPILRRTNLRFSPLIDFEIIELSFYIRTVSQTVLSFILGHRFW